MVNDKPTTFKRRVNSLAIDRLIDDEVFINFYPLHDGPSKFNGNNSYIDEDNDDSDGDDDGGEEGEEGEEGSGGDDKTKRKKNLRAELNETWVKSWGWQPMEKIREYFGEKLSLYFVWIGRQHI